MTCLKVQTNDLFLSSDVDQIKFLLNVVWNIYIKMEIKCQVKSPVD